MVYDSELQERPYGHSWTCPSSSLLAKLPIGRVQRKEAGESIGGCNLLSKGPNLNGPPKETPGAFLVPTGSSSRHFGTVGAQRSARIRTGL